MGCMLGNLSQDEDGTTRRRTGGCVSCCLGEESENSNARRGGCLRPCVGKYFPISTFRLPDCPYKTDISFFTIRALSSTLKRASRATLRGPARLLVPPLTTTTATTTAFPSQTTPWRAFWVTQPRRQPTDPKKRFKKRSTTPSARFPVCYDTFGGKLGCRPRNRLGRSGYGISTLWRCKC